MLRGPRIPPRVPPHLIWPRSNCVGPQFSNSDHPSCGHLPEARSSPTEGLLQATAHTSHIFSRIPSRYLYVRMFNTGSGVQPGMEQICGRSPTAVILPSWCHSTTSQPGTGGFQRSGFFMFPLRSINPLLLRLLAKLVQVSYPRERRKERSRPQLITRLFH